MKKLNIILAFASIVVIILSMLFLFGVIRSKIMPIIFLILGAANIANGVLCNRRGEKREFKIFTLAGVFVMIVALFSQY